MAAVGYMQAGRFPRRLSLRQLMALADQGWISPRMWVRVFGEKGGLWSVRAGSLRLFVAFALTAIGDISQVL
ncbi:hypothetical protein K469DRAFT_716517 [Zopfia rhizophila CBS 207.26]|uniref:Uncharacterized protein n=1 Tax=Zopfia rhizophila CBS 207.26 TaxID=1314779 RepID=A0A6A6DM06_9PEZI|nr:hypothetical protein K469DRAFT_716517 [Zopfia rhizophila CBS 207.26]